MCAKIRRRAVYGMAVCLVVASLGTAQTPKQGRDQAIQAVMQESIDVIFPPDTPLGDVLNFISVATVSPNLPKGLPIYVDAIALHQDRKSTHAPVEVNVQGATVEKALKALLEPLGLKAVVYEGLVLVEGSSSEARRRFNSSGVKE